MCVQTLIYSVECLLVSSQRMQMIYFIYLLIFSFKNQHDLRKHMETHNEGTAYHCTVEGCGYSSRMAHTMNQHYKRVHEVSQQGAHMSIVRP